METTYLPPVVTVWSHIALLITTLAGFAYTIYRENRNRKWDLEDRARARKEALEMAQETQQKSMEHRKIIIDKIDENTDISRLAFAAANNFHQKAQKLAEAYDRVAVSTGLVLPMIQHTGEDTNERVRAVEQAVMDTVTASLPQHEPPETVGE